MSKESNRKKPIVEEKDYPLNHVPMDARKGLVSIAGVLVGFTFFTPTMAAGAQLGAAFSFSDLIWILLAGSIILGVYVAIICAIGAKTGLTSVLLARYTLGSAGAKWADILLGGTQVLWYAITAEYMGSLFAKGLNLPGWETFFIIFWSLLMGFTVLYGFKSMVIASYVALPLMVVLVILVSWMALNQVGSVEALFGMQPTQSMSVTVAITVIVGTFASGGTQAANWGRFAKSWKVAFVAGILAFLFGNGIMVFSGMIGGFAFQTGDLIELMITMGLTFWALVILTLNIWTTNNATAYAFGVAGAEMFGKTNKSPFIIGGVIIATIIAVAGVGAYFIPLLTLFGTLIPPLGGVIIGDYIFTYKRSIPMLEYVRFKVLRIVPLLSYLIGCIVAYWSGVYEIGIPSLQGIIVAGVCVPLLNSICKLVRFNDMHETTEDAKYI